MSLRVAALAFVATIAAAVAACQSSGPYGSAQNAAIGTGIGVAGAVVSRAAGGCLAQCLPGTVCNPRNGLCERTEPRPGATSTPAVGNGRRPPAVSASYPPGHEYEVPAASCDPTMSDAGTISCEMDASTPY